MPSVHHGRSYSCLFYFVYTKPQKLPTFDNILLTQISYNKIMVAQNNQLSLSFDIPIKLGKAKRVHYKIPTYRKVYKNDVDTSGTIKDDTIWGEMQEIYKTLVNYVEVPLFQNIGETYETDGVRLWIERYTNEVYNYQGTDYKGQVFEYRSAEIIGTERLGINERLLIHKKLLAFLRSGATLKDAINKLRVRPNHIILNH